jgi:hypothetical protein
VDRASTLAALLVVALAGHAGAQSAVPLYRSWEWTDEPGSVRAAALGGAVVAGADGDAFSTSLYPASLSLVSETDLRIAVRCARPGTIGLDRVDDRWAFAGGALARPVGTRWGVAIYGRRPRSLELEIRDVGLPGGSTDSGRLEATVSETGFAIGAAVTPRLRLGVRLGAARLDIDGQTATRSSRGTEAVSVSATGAWRARPGLGLLFAADQRFCAAVAYDHGLRWRVSANGDRGRLDHDIVAPARLVGGVLLRPSSVLRLSGQLDWIRWSQVRSALASAEGSPPASGFAIDDAFDGRLGLELRIAYGEAALWHRAVLRLGLHYRSRGLLEYVGSDPVQRARFPGDRPGTEWSVGAGFGPAEVAWVGGRPAKVWMLGVRHAF